MKTVKNKASNKICACSSLPNIFIRKGRKAKRRRKTLTDWQLINKWRANLKEYCKITEEGKCKEEGASGHTHLGIRVTSKQCRYCHNYILELLPHSPFRDMRGRVTGIRVSAIPPPRLYIPTREDIIYDNRQYEVT